MNFKLISSILLLTLSCSLDANILSKSPNDESLNVTTVVKPDDRQQYKNPAWFEVSAKCKVDTQGQDIHLKLELTKGQATIGNTKYKAPTTLEAFTVHNTDKFKVKVSKQAKMAVTLLQEGNTQAIKAVCSINI